MEQGREVFAVPGNITSKMSWGPNLLIRQGAKLVQDWNDVIAELPAEVRRRLIDAGKASMLALGGEPPEQASLPIEPGAAVGRAVLAALRVDSALQLDDILARLPDYSSSEVIAALFELEMLGSVRQLPGKNFAKVW
jgi:DNA processing protein